MEIVNPIAESYAAESTSPLDSLLKEIEKFTLETHQHAHMLSGSVQGKFLEMVSRMVNPLKILEIGTFTGFSALCLLKGLKPGGKLHTIEIREEDAKTAEEFFKKAGVEDSIILHIGAAKEIIPNLEEIWDLIFIDADKVGYIDYYELTLPRLKTGGWILADNVFFHGLIFDENVSGKNAKAILAFNKHVAKDERVEQVMISVRDGLMLIRKK
jgi:predicted O-methyltransferase YrrM